MTSLISQLDMQVQDDGFNEIAKSGNYLPRINLMNSSSELVKLDKIRPGHFAIIFDRENFVDLSKVVPLFSFAWRAKAIDMSKDKPEISYNQTSDLFKEIASKSDKPNSKCSFGPEFLVWCNQEQKFATLHMGSKTARRIASEIMQKMKEKVPFILTSSFIKTTQNSWFGYTVTACSQEINFGELTPELVKAQVEDFLKASQELSEVRDR